jgi:hypothetical protein
MKNIKIKKFVWRIFFQSLLFLTVPKNPLVKKSGYLLISV